MDIRPLIRVLGSIDPSKNAVQAREQAEEAYKNAAKSSPDVVSLQLAEILGASEAEHPQAERQLSAVFLRRLLEDESRACAWNRIGFQGHARIREASLISLAMMKAKAPRRSVVALIAQVARLSLEVKAGSQRSVEPWPEMFNYVFNLAKSAQAEEREQSYEMFEQISEYSPTCVIQYSRTIGEVLAQGLQDQSSLMVRMAALRAFASLLLSIDSDKELEVFKPAVPLMLEALRGTVGHATETNDDSLETAARTGLSALIKLVGEHGKFLKSFIVPLAETMIDIAKANVMQVDTRCLAMEFLVSMCEALPTPVRKQKDLCLSLLPCAIRLLWEGTNPNPNLQSWSNNITDDNEIDEDDEEAQNDEDDFELAELGVMGEEAIGRMAVALGGKTAMQSAFTLVPTLLRDAADWRNRKVALVTLSQLTEGCGVFMYKRIRDIVEAVLPLCADPHPIVRYEAIHVYGSLAMDFYDDEKCGQEGAPSFQKQSFVQVLPALAQRLSGSTEPEMRVRIHSAATLINYFTEFTDLSQADVAPYLDVLLQGLMELTLAAPLLGKQEALKAASNIAHIAGGENFARYYDAFMNIALESFQDPYLQSVPNAMRIVVPPPDETEKQQTKREDAELSTRGFALEAASKFSGTVGRASGLFEKHGQRVMSSLLPCLNQEGDLQLYAIGALPRFASVFGQDFVPILPSIVPKLILTAGQNIDVKILNTSDEEGIQSAMASGMALSELAVRGAPNKVFAMNYDKAQEVSYATYALFSLCDALGEHFAPYAPDTLTVMSKLLDYQLNDAIRNVAALSMGKLVAALIAYAKTANYEANAVAVCRHAIELVVPALLERVSQGLALPSTLEAFVDSFGTSSTAANPDDVVVKAQKHEQLNSAQQGNNSSSNQAGADAANSQEEDLDEDELEARLHLAEALVHVLRLAYESGGAVDNHPHGAHRADGSHPPVAYIPGGTPLFNQLMVKFAEVIQSRAERIVQEHAALESEIREGDVDEETMRWFHGRETKLLELFSRLVEAAGYLLKAGVRDGDGLQVFRQVLMPVLLRLGRQESRHEFHLAAVCLLDDVVEFSGRDAARRDEFVDIVCADLCLRCAPHTSTELVMASVFGLGVCAEHAGPSFNARLGLAQEVLFHVLKVAKEKIAKLTARSQMLKALGEDQVPPPSGEETAVEAIENEDPDKYIVGWGLVADNCLSALEKIVRCRIAPSLQASGASAESVQQQVTEAFRALLPYFPCTEDSTESQCLTYGLVARYRAMMTPEELSTILLRHLDKGFEAETNTWEESDVFIDADTRRAMAAGVSEGWFVLPAAMNNERNTLLLRHLVQQQQQPQQ